MQLDLGNLTRDARRVAAMKQIMAAHPGASDDELAAVYASDPVYDQHTPPETRKTNYDQDERREAALRFILPAARK